MESRRLLGGAAAAALLFAPGAVLAEAEQTTQQAVTPIGSPVAAFDVDAELMFADRKLGSGLDSDLTRLILFAEYGF